MSGITPFALPFVFNSGRPESPSVNCMCVNGDMQVLSAFGKMNWEKKSSQSFKSGTCSALKDVQYDYKTNQ